MNILPSHFGELSSYWDVIQIETVRLSDPYCYATISNGSVVEEGSRSEVLHLNHEDAFQATLAKVREIYPDKKVVFRKMFTLDCIIVEGTPYYICHCRVKLPEVE